jgi:DNA-binding MarR family transcriptional regulator
MKNIYFDSVVRIERLHRLFLEVLKIELDGMKIRDINNVQCLILYNIGEGHLTVGELTQRGYYLGSNVSYNLKKMVSNGYIAQEPSVHDKRSSNVKLSEKGLDLYKKIDAIFDSHSEMLNKDGSDKNLASIQDSLNSLNDFWEGLIASGSRRI